MVIDYSNITYTEPRTHRINAIVVKEIDHEASCERIEHITPCHYGVGADGRIGQYVDEEDVVKFSLLENEDDQHTVFIASTLTDKAKASLTALIADISARNGINEIKYIGNLEALETVTEDVNNLLEDAEVEEVTISTIEYVLPTSMKLRDIAKERNISVFDLLAINDVKNANCNIKQGTTIYIPTFEEETEEETGGETETTFYYVVKGDTLKSIAKKFGLDWKKLAELNNIKPPYKVKEGDLLVLQ